MESPFLVKKSSDASDKLDEEGRAFLLEKIVREDADLMALLKGLQELNLPDWRLVSGAIYQTVWNRLTNKPQGHGIKDYDIAYFDDSDLSYEAEDKVIKQVEAKLVDWAERIEVRNQARVHLWFPEKFGGIYPQLTCTDDSLNNYMCTTHAVAVRLESDDSLSIKAPYGLADIFALTIRPCRALPENKANYAKKARRMTRLWPELKVLDWDNEEPIRPELL